MFTNFGNPHRYQGRLSGPLMDRIDLHVEVPALATDVVLHAPAGESTASMRERCVAARHMAQLRQGKPNQALAGQEIQVHAPPNAATAQFLQSASLRLGWSARSLHRTLKIARTIADLAGSATIELAHAAEALQYRRATAPPPGVLA